MVELDSVLGVRKYAKKCRPFGRLCVELYVGGCKVAGLEGWSSSVAGTLKRKPRRRP
jgi:hypothetical protein